MAEDNFTLTTFYTSWKEYQDLFDCPLSFCTRFNQFLFRLRKHQLFDHLQVVSQVL